MTPNQIYKKDKITGISFKDWLQKENLYVFTLNGFPYGGFHNTIVKDDVHTPDWTTKDRYDYTLRLAHLLAKLLPENLHEGGISTSPLSYKYWWKNSEELLNATHKATLHLIDLVVELAKIEQQTGKWIHIDIEPEPDGILENHKEFVEWYENTLIPLGTEYLQNKGINDSEDLIKRHISCFIFSRRKKKFNYNLYMKLHTYYNIIIKNHTLI
jgi:hypothetical protein